MTSFKNCRVLRQNSQFNFFKKNYILPKVHNLKMGISITAYLAYISDSCIIDIF